MNKKGFSSLYIVLAIFLVGFSLVFYYLKNNKVTNSSGEMYGLPKYTPFILSKAWENGLNTYTNPKINISLQYPNSFSQTDADLGNPNGSQPEKNKLVSAFNFFTPEVPTSERVKENFDWSDYDKNTMRVVAEVYLNSKNQSLENFLKDFYNNLGIDGQTPIYTTLKKNLLRTNIPRANSFVYEGTLGENPLKKVFFTYGDKVYIFTLIGGNDTGTGYSPEAEKVFDQIIASIKLF